MAYVSVEDAIGNVITVDDPESSLQTVVKTARELLPLDDLRRERPRRWKP